LKGTSTDTNPFVVSPVLSKSASALKKVVIRLGNDSPGRWAKLFFLTSSGTWSSSKSKTVAIDPYSGQAAYTFDMSDVPEWTGTITRLRLDPAPATGHFGIDWIRIAPAG
jgi:hypothetical protein